MLLQRELGILPKIEKDGRIFGNSGEVRYEIIECPRTCLGHYELGMKKGKILVIDDEADFGLLFSKSLPEYNVINALSGAEGLDKIKEEVPDIVFIDLVLPDMHGTSVLRKIKSMFPDILVIVLTGHAGVESAVETMKIGAYDYLTKPIPLHRIKIIVENALHVRRLDYELKELKKDISKSFSIEKIITVDKKMQVVLDLVRKAALHDITVLIIGESGTGKEMVAKAIHYESARKDGAFVPVDCASLPETLIESELFGYEKGAFTGADTRKPGKFELANHGTIFLDEITNLSESVQIKLLRILQERELVRLGGKKAIPVDVRVITATNKDLYECVEKGKFRDDLYYRINVLPIRLPPLRDRRDDILPLTKYFLERFNKEFERSIKGISPKAEEILQGYSWHGNIRELENVIKSAIVLATDYIEPEHLVGLLETKKEVSGMIMDGSLKDIKKQAEKEIIEKVLSECKWNKRKTAQKLGIDYKTLYNKIKEYDIK